MKAFDQKSQAQMFLGAGTVLAVLLAALRTPTADWALDGLTGIAALLGVVVASARIALGTANSVIRRLWQLVLALLLVASISAFSGPWAEQIETRLGVDDLQDCLLLFAAFVTLWFATKLERFPVWARRLLWTGFVLHLLATLLDLGDNGREGGLFDPDVVESATDLAQFLSLQFYVLGAAIFVARFAKRGGRPDAGGTASGLVSSGRSFETPARRPSPVNGNTGALRVPALGLRARTDFGRYIALGSLRKVAGSRLYVEGARPIMFLVRAGWCLWKFGRKVAAAGRPLPLQAMDMLRLGWRDGIDPILYPTLELYWPERRSWADHALSRFEVGDGMLRRLHKLRPKPHGTRINLGDKLAFHNCCRAHELPSPRILIHASEGDLNWLEPKNGSALDRDLFIKPRQWRGARNSLWLQRVAPFTWRTQYGETWSREDLFDHLERQSGARDMLLQAMLTNHAEIADLAEQSLIAIRVITAMDENEQPIITHAMLRVISKLEPRWHSKREHAAAIDLATGRLGRMCNDKDLWPGSWSDRHPVTDAPVTGRLLTAWPAIRAVAEAAQRVFSDRMLVGWDIALTPSGPVILEGNSYPDVHFLQRVHEQPIGMSPLGPILQRALDAARVRDRHMVEE